MMRGRGGGGGGSGFCCEECRRRCGLIHGPVSVNKSFFKVLIGTDFSDLLYIPPMFAPEVSRLVGHRVILEDSRGNRWRVKLTEYRGSLALRKGWRDFFSDHGLEIGDFLVFHYLGSHFVVKIYDRTACEKTVFRRGHGTNQASSTRKDSRVRQFLTRRPRFGAAKEARSRLSSNTEAESDDEVVFLFSGEEARRGDRNTVDVSVNEMQVDNSGYGKCHGVVGKELIPRDRAGTAQMLNDGARAKMVVTGVESDDPEEVLNVNPLAIAIYDTNFVPSFPDNASGERPMIRKRGRPRKDRSTMSIKSATSRFENVLHEESVSSLVPRHIDNSPVLKLMGVSSPAPIETSLSLKVTVASMSYLELPVNLLSVLPKSRGVKKSREGRVIILEDQLKRWWPVLYREEQVKFLSTGWKCFSEANHISPGDECLFVARDLSKAIFGVSILSAGPGCT